MAVKPAKCKIRIAFRLLVVCLSLFSVRLCPVNGKITTQIPYKVDNQEAEYRGVHNQSLEGCGDQCSTAFMVSESVSEGAVEAEGTILHADNLVGTIELYTHSVLASIAIIGNLLNLVVLLGHTPALSPYTYLTALAFCDLIHGIMLFWIGVLNSTQFLATSYPARVLSYHTVLIVMTLRESVMTVASYLIMVLGLDRMIAVRFPLQRSIWCTLKRARWATFMIYVGGFVVMAHMPVRLKTVWMWDNMHQVMMPRFYYTKTGVDPFITTVVLYVTLIIRVSIPLFSMLITNTITLKVVIQSQRFREQVSSHKKGDEGLQCVTITIGVIAIFLITNIPKCYYYFNLAINGYPTVLTDGLKIGIMVSGFITASSACANFFVYTVLNRKFRRDLMKIFGCGKMIPNELIRSTNSIKTDMTSTGF